jgi:Flp pilus assembly protein TadG
MPRRGVMALELLFVLPLVLGVLLATVEFSMLLVAQQQLIISSREGARVAAQGGNQDDVQSAVLVFLGQGSLSQATITAMLTDPTTGQPLPSGSPVSVTVSLPATQAVPDLLAMLGYSISNETLTAMTVMRKE